MGFYRLTAGKYPSRQVSTTCDILFYLTTLLIGFD